MPEPAHTVKPLPGRIDGRRIAVDLDHRGLIYLLDRNRGLDILEITRPRTNPNFSNLGDPPCSPEPSPS